MKSLVLILALLAPFSAHAFLEAENSFDKVEKVFVEIRPVDRSVERPVEKFLNVTKEAGYRGGDGGGGHGG